MRRVAHTLVAASATPEPAAARGRRDAGFSLVEVVVVMVILAIMAAVAIPTTGNARRAAEAGAMATAGATIWRAIIDYRVDYRGQMPPASDLASWSASAAGQAQFRSRASHSQGADPRDLYIKPNKWPSHPRSGARIRVEASTSSAPPATDGAGRPRLLYGSSGFGGWLAAYTSRGQRVFCRDIPVGSSGAWTSLAELGTSRC